MDLSSIIGIVLGFLIVIVGIGFGDMGLFWDPASVYIVLGGTLFATMASYPFSQLASAGKHFVMLIQGKKFNPEETIEKMGELAQLARKNGLLALEEQARDLPDPFFKRSVLLIVDAMDEEKVRAMLEEEVANMADRHEEGASIYDKAAAFAPAFGMIGTLIGLIKMLASMDLSAGSSSTLGTSMATAMITTFYGCMLANLLLMPIAKKLRIRNQEEMLYRQIIIEGVLGIQAGDNPKILRERLISYLSQKKQSQLLDDGEGGGKEKKGKKKSKD